MTPGTTIPIDLNDECLLLLRRGGTVNVIIDGVQIRLQQEKPLVIIDREDYRDLKRHRNSVGILEHIFEKINK